MKTIDVRKRGSNWVAESDGAVVATASTKVDAIRRSADLAKRTIGTVSVRIHKATGQFQEERTYPRGADPARSRG